jgi:hypothetical protein
LQNDPLRREKPLAREHGEDETAPILAELLLDSSNAKSVTSIFILYFKEALETNRVARARITDHTVFRLEDARSIFAATL